MSEEIGTPLLQTDCIGKNVCGGCCQMVLKLLGPIWLPMLRYNFDFNKTLFGSNVFKYFNLYILYIFKNNSTYIFRNFTMYSFKIFKSSIVQFVFRQLKMYGLVGIDKSFLCKLNGLCPFTNVCFL